MELTYSSSQLYEQKKLYKRIHREFKNVMYIGDIKINDDEYEILKQYMIEACNNILSGSSGVLHDADPVLATALVHFGIREYNGKFWPHFKKLFPTRNINAVQCSVIGKIFVYTLKKYNKKCLGYDEMVNSILMHAFITEYYAKDLFEFLLMYYERDLDRNLDNHTKEMRNNLIQSMKREDNVGRSYKIKKHTADAVTANEIGCKIRVRRILKMIDDYMFYGVLQEQSTNRVTQLFVNWAKNSKEFAHAKRAYSVGKKGKKRFSSPYLRFETDSRAFCLQFPAQNIPLDDDELDADILWRVTRDGISRLLYAETEESVTGRKTLRDSIDVEPIDLFSEFKVDLLKNHDVIRRFVIRADSVRFFDGDWNMISINNEFIPTGDCFAFSVDEVEFVCGTDCCLERLRGLNLYTLHLESGDYVRYPNGFVKPVGREFEEGLQPRHRVPDAVVVGGNDEEYAVYSGAPTICFTAETKQLPGTLIWINKKKYLLSDQSYYSYPLVSGGSKNGCILKLDNILSGEGVFEVIIDIPGSRKYYSYQFAVIKNLSYEFIDAPYIFRDEGMIRFSPEIEIESSNGDVEFHNNVGSFDILQDYDHLVFDVTASNETLRLEIKVPALKWKFDDAEWEVSKPEVTWYTEVPQTIYLKCPYDSVSFFVEAPEVLDDDNITEDEYRTSFRRVNGSEIIECDTTKMKSWFGREDAVRNLKLDLGDQTVVFLPVVTKCYMEECELIPDYQNNRFIVKGSIYGIADCFVDFYRGRERIAEKVEIRTKGAIIPAELKSGTYSAVFFEQDDEEDEFGFGEIDYVDFDRRVFRFQNPYDLTGKRINIQSLSEPKQANSFFEPHVYELNKKYYIDSITAEPEKALSFHGLLREDVSSLCVKVFFMLDIKTKKAVRLFVENQDGFSAFGYTKKKEIVPEEAADPSTLVFIAKDYSFNITVKEIKDNAIFTY